METFISSLEKSKNGKKTHDFCLDDAIYYLKKAQEVLSDGLADPDAWYESSVFSSKVLLKSLPFILAIQLQESRAEDQGSETGESSPE